MRRKSNITKYKRRRTYSAKTAVTKTANGKKRSLEKTPRKLSFKSPFKSPLFHPMSISPAVKRFKKSSARVLFSNVNAKRIDDTTDFSSTILENSKSLSSVTISADELSSDEFEPLPYDIEHNGVKPLDSEEKHLASYELGINEIPQELEENFNASETYATCCFEDVSSIVKTQESASNGVFEDEAVVEKDYNTTKIISLVPKVLKAMEKHDGLDVVLVNFFEMVSNNAFPLDNIAFLLWTEVVKWFSCSSTTQMRYSAETKLFWKLGWRLFGGRFANFMGGYKSHGDKVLKMADPGNYPPCSSEINFAVPDVRILREHDPYAVEIEQKPGIYEDIISELSLTMHNKSCCITFDGKKLKQGLTNDSGDVDLLGFEKGLTLKDKRDLLENDIAEMHASIESINELKDSVMTEDSVAIKNLLFKSLSKLSENINDLAKVRTRKEYCKQKLIENSGPEWRKGRFVYAISAITAYIHEVDEYLNKARLLIDMVCRYIAHLNKAKFIDDSMVNLGLHEKYISIEEQCETTEEITNTRLVEQRSDQWHQIRKQAKITGSTIYRAIGCDGLARQKDHFENVICGVPEKEPTTDAKAAMNHGTVNEINAVATVVGKIIPVLDPSLQFCEEGCVTISFEDAGVFMVVSTDGSLRQSEDMSTTQVAIEIKCPTKAIHTEVPVRYYLQCQAEISALNVSRLLYVSWTETETTVFQIERDDEIFQKAMKFAVEIYGESKPKKPTRLSEMSKTLKVEIAEKCQEIKMLGRFASCTSSDCPSNTFDTTTKNASDLIQLLESISHSHKEKYELMRLKATEAIVFLLADLDRSWKKDTIRCSPIAWIPKGYSLDSDTMRAIAEEVHTKCTENGLHVPCQSFDGQWHLLVVRTLTGEPLTLFQLQKDIWKEVEKMSKKEILSELVQINKQVIVLNVEDKSDTRKESKRSIAMTNGCINLPKYRKIVKDVKTKKSHEADVCNITLADTVSDVVREARDVTEEVLAMTEVEDKIEQEAFESNTSDDVWSQQLEEIENATEEVEDEIVKEASQQKIPMTGESKLDLKDMECLLSLFRTTKDCNKKGKWDSKTEEQLLLCFESTENISKFLDIELRAIVRYLKKAKGVTGVKESSSKSMKVNEISHYLALSQVSPKDTARKVRKCNIKTLKELSSLVVSKYSKHELNVILAEYKWPEAYRLWKMSVDDITVNNEDVEWFYKPEFSTKRMQIEVKCIDSTHLLTRMRRKSSRGGLDQVPKDCWMKVAKQKNTFLTPIMVEEVTDPMSVSMAKTHFSEAVENSMRRNGDVEAANLCKDIRNWWDADDKPGISSEQRINLRKGLRRRLMSRVVFSRFPPATQYIAGWPQQLWEAILASIDAKAYLYSLTCGGTYNVRAFSSLIGETFFAELTLNDKSGQGTVTAKEFGVFISRSTEQLQIRLNPERKFSYCTSKSRVYDVVDETSEDIPEHEPFNICAEGVHSIPRQIYSRDHVFDMPQRSRLSGRKKDEHVSTELNAVMKGALGVRWEKARSNYSKMLPTQRMGICDTED